MTFDPRNCSPDEIAASWSLEEIEATARKIHAWGAIEAQCFDMVLRTLVLRVLRDREAAAAELGAVSRLLELFGHPRRRRQLAALDGEYGSRWELLRQLVDECLERDRRQRVEQALEIEHGLDLLRLLVRNRAAASQGELIGELGLGASNGTRIVTRLVGCGAVVVRRIGRRNLLSITPAARHLVESDASDSREHVGTGVSAVVASRIEDLSMGMEQLRLMAHEPLPPEWSRAMGAWKLRDVRGQIHAIYSETVRACQTLSEVAESADAELEDSVSVPSKVVVDRFAGKLRAWGQTLQEQGRSVGGDFTASNLSS